MFFYGDYDTYIIPGIDFVTLGGNFIKNFVWNDKNQFLFRWKVVANSTVLKLTWTSTIQLQFGNVAPIYFQIWRARKWLEKWPDFVRTERPFELKRIFTWHPAENGLKLSTITGMEVYNYSLFYRICEIWRGHIFMEVTELQLRLVLLFTHWV